MSFLKRIVVAVLMPLWAVAMIALGVEQNSVWWLLAGIVVGAVGLLVLSRSPLADLILKGRW